MPRVTTSSNAAHPASDLATFEYDALGALGSLLFVQVLPWGLRLLGGAELTATFEAGIGDLFQ